MEIWIAAALLTLAVAAPSSGSAAAVLDQNESIEITDRIPTITRKWDPERRYEGVVIDARTIELEKGETVLAFAELQAVNEVEDSLM